MNSDLRPTQPKRGRITIFEDIWRKITDFVKTITFGSQRPLSYARWNGGGKQGEWERNFDQEIVENPVRDTDVAIKLIWARNNGPICWPAISILSDQIQSSSDGDDQGHTISKTLDDNVTPIDPRIYEILMRVRKEVLKPSVLVPLIYDFISYGDAFASIMLNPKARRIEGILKLPCWEMFRIETDSGELLGYQQRQSLYDPNALCFHPLTVVHWRFQQQTLYGMGLFRPAVDLIPRLSRALDMVDNAVVAIGINPRLHHLPCEYTDEQVNEYIDAYRKRLQKGAITDFFLTNSIKIEPFGGGNASAPDVSQPLGYVEFLIRQIAMISRLPLWLLGIDSNGAQRWQGGPERAFSVLVNTARAQFTAGLRTIYNLELALNNIPKEDWNYRVSYPKIAISPYSGMSGEGDESDDEGIEDLDETPTPPPNATQPKNSVPPKPKNSIQPKQLLRRFF